MFSDATRVSNSAIDTFCCQIVNIILEKLFLSLCAYFSVDQLDYEACVRVFVPAYICEPVLFISFPFVFYFSDNIYLRKGKLL